MTVSGAIAPHPPAETARTAAKAVKPTLGEFAPQLYYFRTAVPQRDAKGEGDAKSTWSLESYRRQHALCSADSSRGPEIPAVLRVAELSSAGHTHFPRC